MFVKNIVFVDKSTFKHFGYGGLSGCRKFVKKETSLGGYDWRTRERHSAAPWQGSNCVFRQTLINAHR
jgi:hypothetical protein